MATLLSITENGIVTERKLTDALEESLLTIVRTQKFPGKETPYLNVADLIVSTLNDGLFSSALLSHPPASVQTIVDKLTAATEELQAAKAAALEDALGK